ncbi:M20/M25/M40 family metallo-hydrolase [Pendulispora rubella]|uniref:M20/M25/M40 family metallo-hydrolase n=1 Tax=Pendulispora rubella TaxID=2741070 RepID=A0ABZ2LDA9_9BACT
MMTKKTLGCASIIALMVGVACSSNDDNPPSNNPGTDACSTIENDVKNDFDTLAKFVAIETYRTENWANEDKVTEGMEKIYAEMKKQVDEFNAGQKTSKLNLTRWDQASVDENGKPLSGEPPTWRVFKISLGSGARRVAIATHLDTVAPGDAGWQPFTLQKKTVEYNGKQEEFWLGRGSIDDKGPAVATLQVIKNIAKKYDGSSLLNDVTVELIFDTSEETAMSMPNYFRLNPTQEPNLAVIFDASWCVRAEKGVERPVFHIKKDAAKPTKGVWIDSLQTPAGPANQIADTATAIIKAEDAAKLDALQAAIKGEYDAYAFDDAGYRRAQLTVTREGNSLKLVTAVAGAQHGSKPEENRADGANPLVSLANFLAYKSEVFTKNDISRMLQFMKWTWGTKVFGEGHTSLQASDEVFQAPNNGTTYAVTRLDDSGTDSVYKDSLVLKIDIRYAQDHHGSAKWNGQTEGFIDQMQDKPSFSKFKGVFGDLIKEFETKEPEPASGPKHPVNFTVKETRFSGPESPVPPDVRKPDGPTFSRISNAYKEVMGQPCPAIAIGGGTDAKNHPNFLAAGALFGQKFGPPINFHGLSEGAPVSELTKSAKIICQFLDDEVKNGSKQEAGVSTSAASMWTKADHELH